MYSASEEDIKQLHDAISSMSEDEREELDAVCAAIYQYKRKRRPSRGGMIIPTRIDALAAIKISEAIELTLWRRD